MKKTYIALLMASLFAVSACSPADETKPANNTPSTTASEANNVASPVTSSSELGADVLATVNGKPVSNNYVQKLVELTEKANPGAPVDVDMLRDRVISQEILVQEAQRLGLDQTDDYTIQADLMTKSLLVSMLYNDFLSNVKITDEEINKEYEFIKQQLAESQKAESKEFLARHILVDSEEKAKEIIARLKAGEDFAALAKEASLDPGSAKDGGSLGSWTNVTVFVPEFGNALAAMDKGASSEEPVKSQFGWHIIQVDDVRTVEAAPEALPELDEHIKEQLRTQLINRKFMEHEAKLIENANVVKSE